MNFDYNETQSMIAQSIRDFAEKEIRPNIMEWDEAQTFPVPIESVGVNDEFGQSGTPVELVEKYGMGREDIKKAIEKVLNRKS